MQRIKTLEKVQLTSGLLALSNAQAGARRHLLEPVNDEPGVYLIMDTNTFKAGEVFGYEGPIPKALAKQLADAESGKPLSEIEQPEKPGDPEEPEEPEEPETYGFDEAKMDRMVGVIMSLEDSDMTRSSGPKVSALKKLLHTDVTEAERDEAWKRCQEQEPD